MSRETFLKELQYFDDNFNVITAKEDRASLRAMDKDKEELKKDRYSQSYNRIDIAKVKQITLSEDNCFTAFYKLDTEWLYLLFEILSNTELGIVYLNDFSQNWRDQKEKNRHDTLVGKIDDVLGIAKNVNYELNDATVNDLKNLQALLNRQHFTESQLFENLLLWVSVILNEVKQGRTVHRVTNQLIDEYFSSDIQFSRSKNINKLQEHTYYYTDAKGLRLFHLPVNKR